MKKIAHVFVLLAVMLSCIPTISSADIFLPKDMSVGNAPSYEAGVVLPITFTPNEKRPIGTQNNLEYGVARAVDNDGLTFFEIITTKNITLGKDVQVLNLDTTIPNIFDTTATNTYVVYAKFYEKNNPENESFFFTKTFSIQPNDKPFTQVRNINFLQSTGARFATIHGPSIYAPALVGTSTFLATSTALEVTFESNQTLTVKPKISFTKIRSEAFIQDILLDPITIKKGETYAVIPLPTFEYSPGVYMGTLSFEDGAIANKVDFQYIVAGESVSVGTVSVMSEDVKKFFTFEIFGTPVDMDRPDASTSTSPTANSLLYKTTITFIDSVGNVVYTTTQAVDFNQNTFKIEIPKEYTDVARLGIEVQSAQGNIVYEGTKDVNYLVVTDMRAQMRKIVFSVVYLLLMVLAVYAIYKRHVKTVIVCVLLMLGMFLTHQAFADISISEYRERGGNTVFTNENVAQMPTVVLRDDIPNTVYTCGENIPVVFKVYYIRCTNSVPNIKAGFSWSDYVTPNTSVTNSVSQNSNVGSIGGHQFYRSYSSYVSKTMPAPLTNPANLYISVNHSGDNFGGNTVTGYSRYKIPVQTSCTVADTVCNCSDRTQVCYQNGTEVSSTPNSPSCALKASCSYSLSGDGKYAIFDTIAINALKRLSYKDRDTNKAITKSYRVKLVGTSTVTHNVEVKDSFDGSVAYASCSTAGNVVDPQNATSTYMGDPKINNFKASVPVVRKGDRCEYNWNVTDVDRCTLTVNGDVVSLTGLGLNGPAWVATLDGLNQRANITCILDATASTTEARVSTSTLCQVLPEVIER